MTLVVDKPPTLSYGSSPTISSALEPQTVRNNRKIFTFILFLKSAARGFFDSFLFIKVFPLESLGTSVQQGDSGGGITFVRLNGLHFLYGIVSIKPLNMNAFAAYTNVTDHMDWLQGVVNALKPRHAS